MNIRRKVLFPLLVLVLAFTAFAFTACNNGQQEEIDPAAVVSSVTLSRSSAFLSTTDSERSTASVTASFTVSESGADVEVNWSSSSAGVATVKGSVQTTGEGDEATTVYTGTITAEGNGVAVITASAGNKSATCIVAVTDTVVSTAEELTAAASAATDGTVIALNKGTYAADVAVSSDAQNVSLVGADGVTVNGSVAFNGGGSCFLSGLTLTGTGSGTAVTVAGAGSSLTLRNVRVSAFENGVSLALAANAETPTSLNVYDSSFSEVWCAVSADSLASFLRVSFSKVTCQFRDANGYYTTIGGTPVTDVTPPSASE